MIGFLTGRIKNIILLQISIFILSLSGIMAKIASTYELFSIGFFQYFILEIIILGIYATLWQQILKKMEMIVAYANRGMYLIWTLFWAMLFFDETITINNILGSIIIILGITMVFKDD
jgi:drug/metabolite transporter (DMT)-like permease